MNYPVSVVLKDGGHYSFNLREDEVDAFDASSAWQWIAEAFEKAGLEPPSPTGKVLLKDQILMLALEQKPADWATPTADLRKFLAATVKSLGRASVAIDLRSFKL